MRPQTKHLLGKPVSRALKLQLKTLIAEFPEKLQMKVLLVGDNPASRSYVEIKRQMAEKLGVGCEIVELPASSTTEQILEKIWAWNEEDSIHGYIVQLPLPAHIRATTIIEHIDPRKDIDGFTATNAGLLYLEEDEERYLAPATSLAVLHLLDHYNIDVEGKDVVVVGKGLIVGKPIALSMMARNASVSVVHAGTRDVMEYTKYADIVITATGQKHLITPKHIKKGAIVIDVGFTKEGDHIFGDVDPEVEGKAAYLSPVPGGVGPLTVMSLFSNLVKAYHLQQKALPRDANSIYNGSVS